MGEGESIDTISPEYLGMSREQWSDRSGMGTRRERLLHLRQMESEEAGTAAKAHPLRRRLEHYGLGQELPEELPRDLGLCRSRPCHFSSRARSLARSSRGAVGGESWASAEQGLLAEVTRAELPPDLLERDARAQRLHVPADPDPDLGELPRHDGPPARLARPRPRAGRWSAPPPPSGHPRPTRRA